MDNETLAKGVFEMLAEKDAEIAQLKISLEIERKGNKGHCITNSELEKVITKINKRIEFLIDGEFCKCGGNIAVNGYCVGCNKVQEVWLK